MDLQFRDVGPFLARRMAKSLYGSYCSQVKWEVPIDRVRWHARVQFINKAYRVYIQQIPNVKETVRNHHMAARDDVGLDRQHEADRGDVTMKNRYSCIASMS